MPRKSTPPVKKTAAKKAAVKKPAKKPVKITFTAKVIDSSTKQPLPKVRVSVFAKGKRTANDTKLTDAQGKARLSTPPSKAYCLAAEKQEYFKTSVETTSLVDYVVSTILLTPEKTEAEKLRTNVDISFVVYNCSTLEPIQGATCTMKLLPNGPTYTATTDADGIATFNVPANHSYDLKVTKSGYTDVTISNVYLNSYSSGREFDFPLCPQ
ncbi:MAG: carboxypeptidase-like regulatory domain-containing protein [Candidatus Hydrogenedentes bacterium]|nr:carboxypeptidase-like regulatory domain-containing protein [Candidatus Hydrogenedentota bacterium]